ncbi:hypothetical protein SAMN05421543_101290 [Alicyclobacillus macrosporangiidus]|uniref:Uncharacterized protein n=1 Tax=Alicyclobacillus macrosporangiidus TaxID=392015 RepID=A0A1I7FJA1_9BACL|nr:hypothetical protein SAMN05421543_101290 [Alicyclobacillus macrosporangiidus]
MALDLLAGRDLSFPGDDVHVVHRPRRLHHRRFRGERAVAGVSGTDPAPQRRARRPSERLSAHPRPSLVDHRCARHGRPRERHRSPRQGDRHHRLDWRRQPGPGGPPVARRPAQGRGRPGNRRHPQPSGPSRRSAPVPRLRHPSPAGGLRPVQSLPQQPPGCPGHGRTERRHARRRQTRSGSRGSRGHLVRRPRGGTHPRLPDRAPGGRPAMPRSAGASE